MKTPGPRTSRTGRQRSRTAIGLIAMVVMALGLLVPGSAGAAGAAQSAAAQSTGVSANPLLGPLSAKYWQWLLSIPATTNPAANPTADCGQKQSGPVFFLAGSFGNDPVQRTCTVPRGKALFFPLINILGVATETGDTVQSIWNDVHVRDAWTITSLSLKVGKVTLLKDSRPSALYRGCAGPERGCVPSSFSFTLPEDPVFLSPGPWEPAIADGYYALLPPLPRGTVTLTFGGAGTMIDSQTGKVVEQKQNVTYTLTVA